MIHLAFPNIAASPCAKPITCNPSGRSWSSSSGSDSVGTPSSDVATVNEGSPVEPSPSGAQPGAELAPVLRAEAAIIRRLAKLSGLEVLATGHAPEAAANAVLSDGSAVSVPLGDLVDVRKECARLEAEAILLLLSEQGICASAGAACSSGSLEPSHVLRAMKIDEKIAHGAIRFSLSRYTTEAEMDRASRLETRLIGINNRDLKTFRTDLSTSERLAARAPEGTLLVAESGIGGHADLERLAASGIRCFLVGESLMRHEDVAEATRTLLGG